MIILGLALAVAFPALKPGAVVTLSPGRYPLVAIVDRHFSPPVTIEAGTAEIAGVSISNSSGIVWRGGTITAPAGPVSRTPAGYGVNIRRSQDIAFDGGTITGAMRGMVMANSRGISVRNVNFTDLRSDGIDMAGVSNIRIENNRFGGFAPVKATGLKSDGTWKDGDHPDAIQGWTTAITPTNSDVTIRGNRIEGITQGINFFGPMRDGYSRIVIENNDLRISYPPAITLYSCTDCKIRFNTVRPFGDSKRKANIRTENSTAEMCGNTMPATPDHPATKRC